jgi:hypothetical protein
MLILGISLGTTTTGVAVLSDGELIFWHTHSFRDKWSDDKAALIASCYEEYVTQYEPTIVMVKVPPVYHHSTALKQLLEKLKSLFTYHCCMVEYKTKEEVKAAIIPVINNHDELMRHTSELYPILQPEYAQAVAGKNNYHAKLFDAVMVAHQGKELVKKDTLIR